MLKRLRNLLIESLKINSKLIVNVIFLDVWKLRSYIKNKEGGHFWNFIYDSYFENFGGFVGIGAELEDIPCFPHGFMGVFISNSAHVGKKCVIFQQVTIGSNTLKDSKARGGPTIGDNVYIGCGAKIIGNVKIGNNVRIGANAIIVRDVPDNSTAIMRGLEIIVKERNMDNTYVANHV